MRGKPLFDVTMADPPWRGDNASNRAAPDRNLADAESGEAGEARAEHAYSSMSLQDICDLPVGRTMAPCSLLALWAPWIMTFPSLRPGGDPLRREDWDPPQAHLVAASWGFPRCATGVPWMKGRWEESLEFPVLRYGMGNYVRVASEVLLLFPRGGFRIPPEDRIPGLLYPRGGHSEKPDIARDFLERLLPRARRAELFSRTFAAGWCAWGAEAPDPDPSLIRALGDPRL